MAILAKNTELEVLFSREEIARRVDELGQEISRDFAGRDLLLIGVLKGAAIFLSDLARSLTVGATFDFFAVSSYGAAKRTSHELKVLKDIDTPVEGRNVLLVEDILDTGLTVVFLRKLLEQRQPRCVKVATCLDKPSRRLEKIEADYVGYRIPNHFVVGYGMDYGERFRNLPEICILPSSHPE